VPKPSREKIYCFFCKQQYWAGVLIIDGIQHPDLEQQLVCPNPDCQSNSGKPSTPPPNQAAANITAK